MSGWINNHLLPVYYLILLNKNHITLATPCRRPVVLPATRPSSIPNLQPITLGRSHNQGSSADITPIMAPDVRDTSAPETGALSK